MNPFFIWVISIVSVYFYCDAALFPKQCNAQKVGIRKVSFGQVPGSEWEYEYTYFYNDVKVGVPSSDNLHLKKGDSAYLLTSPQSWRTIIWTRDGISYEETLNYHTEGFKGLLHVFPFLIIGLCMMSYGTAASEMEKLYNTSKPTNEHRLSRWISLIRFHLPLVIALIITVCPVFYILDLVSASVYSNKAVFSFIAGTVYIMLLSATYYLATIMYHYKYSKDPLISSVRDVVKIIASAMALVTISGYLIAMVKLGRAPGIKEIWDLIKLSS